MSFFTSWLLSCYVGDEDLLEMNYFVHKYICTHTTTKNGKTAIMGLIRKSICLLFYHFLFPLLNGFGFAWHLIRASGHPPLCGSPPCLCCSCKRVYNLVWFGIVSCGLFVCLFGRPCLYYSNKCL